MAINVNDNGQEQRITSNVLIANAFQSHFSSKIKEPEKEPCINELLNITRSLYTSTKEWDVETCTEDNIAKIITKMTAKPTPDSDHISTKLLKSLAHIISRPLTKIINTIIMQQRFLPCLKNARVKPIFKKRGDPHDVQSYRPVSISSAVGKVAETAIRQQIVANIEPLYSDNIYGYRKNRGTADAIIKVYDSILKLRDKGKKVICIACDAKSTYDLLSRELVIKTIKIMGAGERTQKLLQNYLSNRKQFVEINGAKSKVWQSNVGLLQVVNPSGTLYNVGTISQGKYNQESNSTNYADDGIEIVSGKTAEECICKAKTAIRKTRKWLTRQV